MKIKTYKPVLVLAAVFLTLSSWANNGGDAGITSGRSLMEWIFHNLFAVLGLVIIVAAFAAILYMARMLFQLQKVRLLQEHGIEAMEEVKLIAKEPWWTYFAKKAWSLVPIEQEKDIEFDHEYDGIRELDNVLPPWWVAMFYASIAFGVFYLGYYHLTGYGVSSAEEYEIEMVEAEKSVKAYLASQPDQVDETNVVPLTDETELSLGQAIFNTNCVACHGTMGEGNAVGPNLTDEYWINGGGIKNVFKTIKYGVPEKGMISWKTQLRVSDMHRVASYILSLQGTNPPNAKEPQGDLWKEGEGEEQPAEKGDELSLE